MLALSITPNSNLILGIMAIAGAILLVAGPIVTAGLQKIWSVITTFADPPDRASDRSKSTSHDSDEPAPAGVGKYLDLIENTVAVDCPAEVRWGYASAALTEAQVLAQELQRKDCSAPTELTQ